jgi:hypothetical protein
MRFAEDELAKQFRISDQLDGKAGALLGFAVLLAAIAGQLQDPNAAVAAGVAVAVLAAFFALIAAIPRKLDSPDPKIFADLYVRQSSRVVAQALTATRHDNIEKNTELLERKRRWLAAAFRALLAAGVLTGAGMLWAFGVAEGC